MNTSKPTLLNLLNRHRVSAISLAHVARVPVETVRALIWQTEYVPVEIASRVVAAFNRMTRESYTLEHLGLSGSMPEKTREEYAEPVYSWGKDGYQ